MQETTATVLTAALASKESETLSGSSDIGLSGQGSSSNTVVPSPSLEKHSQSSEARLLEASEMTEYNKSQEHLVEVNLNRNHCLLKCFNMFITAFCILTEFCITWWVGFFIYLNRTRIYN